MNVFQHRTRGYGLEFHYEILQFRRLQGLNGFCREFRRTNVRRLELEGRMNLRREFRLNGTELGIRESHGRNFHSQLYVNERERHHRTLIVVRSKNGILQSAKLIYRLGDVFFIHRTVVPSLVERDEWKIHPRRFQFDESHFGYARRLTPERGQPKYRRVRCVRVLRSAGIFEIRKLRWKQFNRLTVRTYGIRAEIRHDETR